MLAFLDNYTILADTNVWISWKAPARAKAPAAVHPGCLAIRQAKGAGNKALAQKHLVDNLKECLQNGRYACANQLMDTAEKLEIPQPKSVLKFYLNTVLRGYEKQKDWESLLKRFSGKEGKKVFRRLMKHAPGSYVADTIKPKLDAWKGHCRTDAQRKAIETAIPSAHDMK